MLDKIKEIIANEKDLIVFGVATLIVCAVIWNVFSPTDNGQRINSVRDNLQSVGTEQQRARETVTESKRIATEIRTTNQSITREIDTSRELNKSSAELITEGKSILRSVRERN